MKRYLTYEQVADARALTGAMKLRYLAYMRARWADTEAQKSQDGYADEWARRFQNGVEYSASDSGGQRILLEAYPEIYCGGVK